jgi:hypothetical protein
MDSIKTSIPIAVLALVRAMDYTRFIYHPAISTTRLRTTIVHVPSHCGLRYTVVIEAVLPL